MRKILLALCLTALGSTAALAQGRCDPPYPDQYIQIVRYIKVDQGFIERSSSGQPFRDYYEEAKRRHEKKPRLRAAWNRVGPSHAGDIILAQYRQDDAFIDDYLRANQRREWMIDSVQFTLVAATPPPWNLNRIVDAAVRYVIFDGYYLRKDCPDYYLWVDNTHAVRVTSEFPHINDIYY